MVLAGHTAVGWQKVFRSKHLRNVIVVLIICEQPKPCKGCCKNCENKLDECECDQYDSSSNISGNKAVVKLFKKNKSENIAIVKELMESMGLTIEDLK